MNSFLIFARGLRERRQGDSGIEFERKKGGKGGEVFIRRSCACVCVCVSVHALYLRVNAFTDGRIFGWTLINRSEHFVTERLSRITLALSCQLGISVC